MHGIFSDAEAMTQLVGYIKNAHPGTEVYNVDAYNDLVRQMLQVFILSIERHRHIWECEEKQKAAAMLLYKEIVAFMVILKMYTYNVSNWVK